MKVGVLGGLALALLLAAAGCASAGTETRPEIEDPRDMEDPVADILAVWFEPDPDGVKVTVKVASIPRQRPNLLFVVPMTVDGGRGAPALGFRDGGGLLAQQEFGGETRGNDLLKADFGPGTPATLSAVIPWGAYGGLERGSRLTDVEAYSSVLREGERQWRAPYDTTTSEGVYVVPRATASPAPSAAPASSGSPVPLSPGTASTMVLVACTLAGAGVGAYVVRSTRRAPQT